MLGSDRTKSHDSVRSPELAKQIDRPKELMLSLTQLQPQTDYGVNELVLQKIELNLSGINAGEISDADEAKDIIGDNEINDAANIAEVEPKTTRSIELNEKL